MKGWQRTADILVGLNIDAGIHFRREDVYGCMYRWADPSLKDEQTFETTGPRQLPNKSQSLNKNLHIWQRYQFRRMLKDATGSPQSSS